MLILCMLFSDRCFVDRCFTFVSLLGLPRYRRFICIFINVLKNNLNYYPAPLRLGPIEVVTEAYAGCGRIFS
jgi:hypothetical protein